MVGARSPRPIVRVAATLFIVVGIGGCELTEVTLVESDDVLIVEGLVQLRQGPSLENDVDNIRVFLHRTIRADGSSGMVPGARVTVSSPSGWSFDLSETQFGECVVGTPDLGTGSCYGISIEHGVVRPGDRTELLIELPGGGVAEAFSRLPGDFALSQPAENRCVVPPEQNFEITWTIAERAWAYVSETSIFGIRTALDPVGINLDHDTLDLTGLAISSADTLIVFPAELGVLSRTELEQDLALELQKGLPAGTDAAVAIAAVDRNFVNWARGGNFNPSGTVRVPSVIGDATGFFGSAVVRSFDVVVDAQLSGELPLCGPPAPPR